MYAESFVGELNGVVVFVSATDPNRPTCGNIYNKGYNFQLVTTSELDNVEYFTESMAGWKHARKLNKDL